MNFVFFAFVILLQCNVGYSQLDGDVGNLPTMNDLMKQIHEINQTCQMKLETMENQRQSDRRELQALKQSIKKTVAFSTTLSHSITSIGDNQPIVYDRVLTNVGNGYDSQLGHFTAPADGIYFITVSLMGKPGETIEARLIKNGVALELIYSDGRNSGYETGTESIIVHLNVGDRLWVKYTGGSDRYIHLANYNTFSGFLI